MLIRAVMVALALAIAGPVWAQSGPKVALVVGVGDFTGGGLGRLRNPPNDARAVAEKLRALDFDVIERINPDQGALLSALDAFETRAEGAEVGLIYYSGHGIENDGENYLFSAGSGPRGLRWLQSRAVTLSQMLDILHGVSGLRVAILDACRDNTLIDQLTATAYSPDRAAGLKRGLSRPPRTSGDTLIAYATGENDTASDGTGDHSPFTQALLDHLERPVEMRILFGHIRDATAQATAYKQLPEVIGRMGAREYYFAPPTEEDPCDGVNYPDGWRCVARGGQAYPERVAEPKPEPGVITVPGVPQPPRDPYADLSPAELSQKGYEAYAAEDYTAAHNWYERAAERGRAGAMSNLGVLYHSGLGVERDYAAARGWYERAAEQGSAQAMNNLGFFYRDGLGVAQDYATAHYWYERAAEKGSANAMHNLGHLYEDGDGVTQDYYLARRWWEHAVAAGDHGAVHDLAILYAHGRAVEQDHAKAASLLMQTFRDSISYAREDMRDKSSAWPRSTRRALQRELRDAGVYSGAIDGDIGPGTLAAIDAIFGQAE